MPFAFSEWGGCFCGWLPSMRVLRWFSSVSKHPGAVSRECSEAAASTCAKSAMKALQPLCMAEFPPAGGASCRIQRLTSTLPHTTAYWWIQRARPAKHLATARLCMPHSPSSHAYACSIVVDKESGRPKGFGFCEFFDVATAESAFRNLNGTDLSGRNIRIDYAEDFQTRGGCGGGRDYRGAFGLGFKGEGTYGQQAGHSSCMARGCGGDDGCLSRRVRNWHLHWSRWHGGGAMPCAPSTITHCRRSPPCRWAAATGACALGAWQQGESLPCCRGNGVWPWHAA